MYQTALQRFSSFEAIRLSTPAPLYRVILMALDCEESGWSEEDGEKEKIAQV
jgi:DNA mismatch repair protein MLH1